MFFRLFYLDEQPALSILALFSLVVLLCLLLPIRRKFEWRFRAGLSFAIFFAIAVLLLCRLGSRFLMHDFDFSMDEFNPTFQSRIYAENRLEGALPPRWKPFGFALSPLFVIYHRGPGTWIQSYLPVYAAFRSIFVRTGVEHWTNPAMAACSILLIFGVGRRLWPNEPQKWGLAVLFLGLSSQFLLMSTTGYAYPSHLCLNLLWLWLFFHEDSRIAWLIAPWVGFLALGLHNPLPHALFVIPFLATLLRRGRVRWLTYFAVVYGFSCLFWFEWLKRLWGVASSGEVATALFRFPGNSEFFLQSMYATIIFTWQSPILALGSLLFLTSPSRRDPRLLCLAGGVALTLLVYSLYPDHQGHGWGYRYVYAVLANLMLIGVEGVDVLKRAKPALAGLLLPLSFVISVAFQVPIRAFQAERMISPFAEAVARIEAMRGSVVLVGEDVSWFARDLVRNDPFLRNDPKVLHQEQLTPKLRKKLESEFVGRIHVLQSTEIPPLGLPEIR